jgi:amino acid transporter
LYIPTLIALGLLSVAFADLFESFSKNDMQMEELKTNFGFSLGLFLIGICLMLFFLEYPSFTKHLKKQVQRILLVTAALFLILTHVNLHLSLFVYLVITLMILLTVIYILNKSWYALKLIHDKENANTADKV